MANNGIKRQNSKKKQPAMKFQKITYALLGLMFFASLSVPISTVEAGDPTGYDLAAAVNAYRAANGYYEMNYNSLVASAAQAHADWIVSTGQGGHTGAYGEDETVRVSWTGYGGGSEILCDEAWASGSNINDVIYSAWSDWTHQEVMLNQWGNLYTDVGGGVAVKSKGYYVFVLNVCKVYGQEYDGSVPDSSPGDTPGSDPAATATADFSNIIYDVTTATPQADGSITHIVLYGQSLAAIAEAYGVSIETLRELNDMAADDSVIWVDQELLIQAGVSVPTEQAASEAEGSATADPNAEPTASPTPEEPTVTPRPTRTLLPDVPTATPGEMETAAGNSLLLRNLGLVLVIVCGGGLAAFLVFSSKIK